MKQNPKMAGSNLIDCVPQHGPCPNNCDQCFYNKWFYAGHEPVIPTLEEAKGKIVRVNSGNDSNYEKQLVLDTTEQYPNKFYNTSIPDMDFAGNPVVLTINPQQDTHWTAFEDESNLMFVRFRAHPQNIGMAIEAVEYYCRLRSVPLVMTFMRYYDEEAVPWPYEYEARKHIDHEYWDISQEEYDYVMTTLYKACPTSLLFTCGTPESPYCRDCGVCETLYWRHMVNQGRYSNNCHGSERVARLLEDMKNGT